MEPIAKTTKTPAAPENGAPSSLRKGATSTQAFGAGRRESHDASEFYARFTAPEVSDDETVNPLPELSTVKLDDWCVNGDARNMSTCCGHRH